MNRFLKLAGCRLLSAPQRAVLHACLAEFTMALRHRAGLRQIRVQSLGRPRRLNLGSGEYRKEGFLNIDACPGADVTLDLRNGLPFESNCCELIFSEHFFEHIEYPEPIRRLLADCLRVLVPGGELRFSVPDTEWALTEYSHGPGAPYFKACAEHAWHPQSCTTRLEHINYHFRQDGQHRYAYDFETADKLLKEVGFNEVVRRPFDVTLDSQHREAGSLLIAARKLAAHQI